ncbi:MAG TPA: Gfo/Idh/MocA family oxidoreductase [Thermomicrobiales bacterium]
MKQLRAAVIGVGMIGSLHARVYAEDPRAELVAVTDANAERAKEIGAQFGVPWFTNVEEMLASTEIDLVSVATPEQYRYEPAIACAKAGKHLLLEKPLAPNVAGARKLVADIKETGVTATVNFICRSDPRYLHAKAAVAEGAVGEPCTYYARRVGSRLGAEIYGPWTDLLISTAIHDIDAVIWINGGRVTKVYGEAVVKRSAEWGREDAVMAILRFDNGAIATIETSWVLPPTIPAPLDAALRVVGTAGSVTIDGANHGVSQVTEQGFSLPDLTHWPIGARGIYGDIQAHISGYVADILSGRQPVMSLDEAVYVQEVVDAIKASLASGEPVALPLSEGT